MTQLVFPGEYSTLTPNHSHEKALGPQWGGVVVLVVDQGHERFVFGLEFELSQTTQELLSGPHHAQALVLNLDICFFCCCESSRAECDRLPFLAVLL